MGCASSAPAQNKKAPTAMDLAGKPPPPPLTAEQKRVVNRALPSGFTSAASDSADRKAAFASLGLLSLPGAEMGFMMEPPYMGLQSKTNQDFGFAQRSGDDLLVGVFDGHGDHGGQHASKLAALAVAELAAPKAAAATTFEARLAAAIDGAEMRLRAELPDTVQFAGTTASVALLGPGLKAGAKLSVANVGDSRLVVGAIADADGSTAARWKERWASADHKPEAEEETKRIEAAGATVIDEDPTGDRPWLMAAATGC